mmetsp:Transcript_9035/g.21123  ORF Transcript_9035/g.21123 Transcript_9035/m.21123 type:complete len:410 (+) Transcript_9035:1379-2608(+)
MDLRALRVALRDARLDDLALAHNLHHGRGLIPVELLVLAALFLEGEELRLARLALPAVLLHALLRLLHELALLLLGRHALRLFLAVPFVLFGLLLAGHLERLVRRRQLVLRLVQPPAELVEVAGVLVALLPDVLGPRLQLPPRHVLLLELGLGEAERLLSLAEQDAQLLQRGLVHRSARGLLGRVELLAQPVQVLLRLGEGDAELLNVLLHLELVTEQRVVGRVPAHQRHRVGVHLAVVALAQEAERHERPDLPEDLRAQLRERRAGHGLPVHLLDDVAGEDGPLAVRRLHREDVLHVHPLRVLLHLLEEQPHARQPVVLDGPADLALLRLRPGVLGGRGWLAGKLLRRHPRLLSGLAGKLLTAHRLPALRLALELLPTHRLPALGLAAAHRLPRLALVLLPALLLHRN